MDALKAKREQDAEEQALAEAAAKKERQR